jgi:outer membrane biosynthesis protein TonB
VNPVDPQHEQALRTQLEQSHKQLAAFAGELRTIDAELEELADERQQYALLHDACAALEKLEEQDVADLFWSGLASVEAGQAHIGLVRERVDEFQQRLGQIEAARQGVLAKIAREEENAEWLEDDLYELKRNEEERKREWIVEREMSALPARPTVMPWTRGGEDDQRFRKALALCLLLSLLFGLLFPFIPLPVLDRWEVIEVPDRFTSLIKEERPVPPPVQELRPEEQKPVEEETPLLAEEGTPEPAETKQEPEPGAGAKGILAFREKFSSLADAAPAKLGSQARIRRDGEAATGRPTRSLVTTNGPGSSGGIDLAGLSRDVGGGGGQGIQGVQLTQATSAIGAIGGGTDRPLSGGPGSSRTDEEIQIVFDRHKAALYRLYNRELRRNPTLQGQIVLRMTIEPDGSVSLCEVNSSDMKAPNLAGQVVERVKTFDFGAKDGIGAITILYPIDFLPAT